MARAVKVPGTNSDFVPTPIVPDGVPAGAVAVIQKAKRNCLRGWYVGDEPSLLAFGSWADIEGGLTSSATELAVRGLLSRDRMHHSVGWWRNADYECCWHLSLSCKAIEGVREHGYVGDAVPYEQIPEDEVRAWADVVFGEWKRWVWNEPGGTDPRLSMDERRRNAKLWHLRLFVHHEPPHQAIFPEGEVYDLTRWVDGLTPEKVDR